jgi:hypothetical protein
MPQDKKKGFTRFGRNWKNDNEWYETPLRVTQYQFNEDNTINEDAIPQVDIRGVGSNADDYFEYQRLKMEYLKGQVDSEGNPIEYDSPEYWERSYDKPLRTQVDPMLKGKIKPGQGELDNIPDPKQDPMLKGTGQKGELEGTPTTPSDDYLEELEEYNQVLMDEVGKGFTLDQALHYGFGLTKKLNKEKV